MENEAVITKDRKVEIPGGGLSRKGCVTKHNCLCSPTTHTGSFRCRLHRGVNLQRTKSMDSPARQDVQPKATKAADRPTQNNAVNVQY